MNAPVQPPVVSSPCVGICRLDARGLCEGCLRSGEEIARWRAMSEAERVHYMQVLLPQRRVAA